MYVHLNALPEGADADLYRLQICWCSTAYLEIRERDCKHDGGLEVLLEWSSNVGNMLLNGGMKKLSEECLQNFKSSVAKYNQNPRS